MLSDSDMEDEAIDPANATQSVPLAKVVSRSSTLAPRRRSVSRDQSPVHSEDEDESVAGSQDEATSAPGELHAEEQVEEPVEPEMTASPVAATVKKDTLTQPNTPARHLQDTRGPRKTKVMVKDAAWSTWWAVLYWVGHSRPF
jgi:hypothetical protein